MKPSCMRYGSYTSSMVSVSSLDAAEMAANPTLPSPKSFNNHFNNSSIHGLKPLSVNLQEFKGFSGGILVKDFLVVHGSVISTAFEQTIIHPRSKTRSESNSGYSLLLGFDPENFSRPEKNLDRKSTR